MFLIRNLVSNSEQPWACRKNSGRDVKLANCIPYAVKGKGLFTINLTQHNHSVIQCARFPLSQTIQCLHIHVEQCRPTQKFTLACKYMYSSIVECHLTTDLGHDNFVQKVNFCPMNSTCNISFSSLLINRQANISLCSMRQ